MGYQALFKQKLDELHHNGGYRYFKYLEKQKNAYPKAFWTQEDGTKKEVIIWCSNDYLAMGQHKDVCEAAKNAIDTQGAGAGGTRNIGGSNKLHQELEASLAQLHHQEAALTYASGWVSNMAGLSALGNVFEDIIFISDVANHNSIIHGIRASKGEKAIFRHNDMDHLEEILKSQPLDRPKIIVFESVYSMNGYMAPIEKICDLADQYNAMTWIDEVHAVGLYGYQGGGATDLLDLHHRLTFIEGTLAKGIGNVGGYVTGSTEAIDVLRSFGHGFIFSTALPPSILAGAKKSIEILMSPEGRERRALHQKISKATKKALQDEGFPVLENSSHIVPLMVGDAFLCKEISDCLIHDYGIYVQPINYPTVPKGTERLRITPSPLHTEEHIQHLLESLIDIRRQKGDWAKNYNKKL